MVVPEASSSERALCRCIAWEFNALGAHGVRHVRTDLRCIFETALGEATPLISCHVSLLLLGIIPSYILDIQGEGRR